MSRYVHQPHLGCRRARSRCQASAMSQPNVNVILFAWHGGARLGMLSPPSKESGSTMRLKHPQRVITRNAIAFSNTTHVNASNTPIPNPLPSHRSILPSPPTAPTIKIKLHNPFSGSCMPSSHRTLRRQHPPARPADLTSERQAAMSVHRLRTQHGLSFSGLWTTACSALSLLWTACYHHVLRCGCTALCAGRDTALMFDDIGRWRESIFVMQGKRCFLEIRTARRFFARPSCVCGSL